jgi:hypothetical protein
MLDKTLSPTSSEKHFSEIKLDPQEAQDIAIVKLRKRR